MKNLIALINKFSQAKNLNIGSGKNPWLGWTSLDELEFPGIKHCIFSDNCVLDIESMSKDLVYSSHCFEHLSDNTVERLLSESRRVLALNGKLLIKIPDFDWFLNAYRSRTKNFMDGILKFWPTWSWENFGVEDNDLNKMSYIFCGYWNENYGDHFSNNIDYGPSSYNGPARIKETKLRELFNDYSVREITSRLREECIKDKSFKSFNHRNSWSKKDLINLISKHGFTVKNANRFSLTEDFKGIIPDINFMGSWSLYILAEKS